MHQYARHWTIECRCKTNSRSFPVLNFICFCLCCFPICLLLFMPVWICSWNDSYELIFVATILCCEVFESIFFSSLSFANSKEMNTTPNRANIQSTIMERHFLILTNDKMGNVRIQIELWHSKWFWDLSLGFCLFFRHYHSGMAYAPLPNSS